MSKNDESTRRPLSLKAKATPEAEAPRIEERLHKVLAQAGLGSRRALEQRIADGLIGFGHRTQSEIDGKFQWVIHTHGRDCTHVNTAS